MPRPPELAVIDVITKPTEAAKIAENEVLANAWFLYVRGITRPVPPNLPNPAEARNALEVYQEVLEEIAGLDAGSHAVAASDLERRFQRLATPYISKLETIANPEVQTTYDLKWLRGILDEVEKSEAFITDVAEVLPASLDMGRGSVSFASLRSLIEAKVVDTNLKRQMLQEVTARFYLHDAFVNFYISRSGRNFNLEELNLGYTDLGPTVCETLLHNLQGVHELVGIALSMYEMALKGKLPPFGNKCKSHNFHLQYSSAVSEEIGRRLGSNGQLASSIAFRLVYATAMIPFYENDFKAAQSMQMRDVMNAEGHRVYYGDPKRRSETGQGVRQHGFPITVGKYFNLPDGKNFHGHKLNPVIEVSREPGEPVWDLVSDYWAFAAKIDPVTEEQLRGPANPNSPGVRPLQTLSRNNRYRAGETPDFAAVQAKLQADGVGQLSAAEIAYLQGLPWGEVGNGDGASVVKYQDIRFLDARGRDLVNQKSFFSWVDQFKQRKGLYDFLHQTKWSAGMFLHDNWFAATKTTFDYLATSGNGIRDMVGETQSQKFRQFQALLLYSILQEHSPGVETSSPEDWWSVPQLIEIISFAESENFISSNQARWMEKELGLTGGVISKAAFNSGTRAAFKALGFPGK